MERNRFTPNIYVEKDNHYELVIFSSEERGCEEIARAKVSADQLPVIAKYKWGIDGRGYVRNKHIKLHQIILGRKQGYEIDHINGDVLDNRNENLRFVTHTENMRNINKDKVVGVSWDKSRNKWVAQITVNYKNYLLGRFHSFEEAVEARRKGEQKYWNN